MMEPGYMDKPKPLEIQARILLMLAESGPLIKYDIKTRLNREYSRVHEACGKLIQSGHVRVDRVDHKPGRRRKVWVDLTLHGLISAVALSENPDAAWMAGVLEKHYRVLPPLIANNWDMFAKARIKDLAVARIQAVARDSPTFWNHSQRPAFGSIVGEIIRRKEIPDLGLGGASPGAILGFTLEGYVTFQFINAGGSQPEVERWLEGIKTIPDLVSAYEAEITRSEKAQTDRRRQLSNLKRKLRSSR